MDPEKMDEKCLEHSPDTRVDNLNYENSSSSQAAIEQQKSASQPSGILGTFSKLGNLPEWHVPGFGLLQGKALNNAISWCSCLAFLMFGYDQGVLSGVLTLDDFQRHFPLMTPRDRPNNLCWLDAPTNTIPDPNMCTGSPSILSACVAVYQIGCFLGAVLILFYGETWGRKSSSFWGSFIMIVGTIIQVAAGGTSGGGVDGYALLSIGRVVGGIGNGMVTATIPTWQSECAKPEKRGRLIITSGAVIVAGVMISYWVTYGFYFLPSGESYSSVRWRFPIAFQSFFTVLVMIGLCFLPDSPRWLVMRGRHTEARHLLARLADAPVDSEEVDTELTNIKDALEAQSKDGPFKMKELLYNGPSQNLRRTLLGVAAQFFQQISGINLITYYATYVFENSLGFGPDMSRLLSACNGTEYFLAGLVAIPLIERAGRRKLMLFGAFGMMASMAIMSGMTSTASENEFGAPVLEPKYGITAVVFMFAFNTFFAIGWLGMTWLYPAEITNLRIRIQANALSTCSNWISNFLIVMITPPAFANLQYNTYTMFAVFNACLIPSVYFFFPEPKGRSLEELDVIFASAHHEGINPVKQAKDMPKLTGRELDVQIARYFGGDVEEARRRSVASAGITT
ncbi:Sugar transporter [Alternaria arborescens]|uniref:Sugar transporter n=1 Tax=Alternaria arborescens TaxID=156630 RepID=A0A4Q4SM76_9PLEO|nr:Sugar transporter [Alternaria arborescens]